jgi:hypothetical protein
MHVGCDVVAGHMPAPCVRKSGCERSGVFDIIARFSAVAYHITGTLLWFALMAEAAQQPIEFPHNKHVAKGLECIDCHITVDTAAAAGLPSKMYALPYEIRKERAGRQKARSICQAKA